MAYVSEAIASGGYEYRNLLDPRGGRSGYVAQWWEIINGMGLRLVTQSRQPGSEDQLHIRTAQEVYLEGDPDGTIGRWALVGEPVEIARHGDEEYDPRLEDRIIGALRNIGPI